MISDVFRINSRKITSQKSQMIGFSKIQKVVCWFLVVQYPIDFKSFEEIHYKSEIRNDRIFYNPENRFISAFWQFGRVYCSHPYSSPTWIALNPSGRVYWKRLDPYIWKGLLFSFPMLPSKSPFNGPFQQTLLEGSRPSGGGFKRGRITENKLGISAGTEKPDFWQPGICEGILRRRITENN